MSAISNTIPASIQIQMKLDATGAGQASNIQGNNPIFIGVKAALQNASGLASMGGGGATSTGAAATSPGTFSLPGIDNSSWDKAYSQISQIGSSLDSMQDQAMQLMSSKNPSDQMKGQMMMQQFQQVMSAIMKAIQIVGDEAKQAINSSEAH